MLIIGARGFAKEVLEILHQNGETENLCFYDDVNKDAPEKLFGEFKVLKNVMEAAEYFRKIDKRFTIGIGKPHLRKQISEKFENLGGQLSSTISKFAEIGSFGVEISNGCNILGGARISNDVKIGRGTMVYYNAVITHDVEIGDFVEISPGATLLGRCKIGNNSHIATGAIIFPDVVIGNNTIIAAGAVVKDNIPDNVMVVGMPAVIKKQL